MLSNLLNSSQLYCFIAIVYSSISLLAPVKVWQGSGIRRGTVKLRKVSSGMRRCPDSRIWCDRSCVISWLRAEVILELRHDPNLLKFRYQCWQSIYEYCDWCYTLTNEPSCYWCYVF